MIICSGFRGFPTSVSHEFPLQLEPRHQCDRLPPIAKPANEKDVSIGDRNRMPEPRLLLLARDDGRGDPLLVPDDADRPEVGRRGLPRPEVLPAVHQQHVRRQRGRGVVPQAWERTRRRSD